MVIEETSKPYDLTILTGEDTEAGTAAQVWLKFDGSRGSTGWFEFRETDATVDRRHFLPGKVDCATVDFNDLGELRTCAVELRDQNADSWLPQSIELVDGAVSYTWQFAIWIRSGETVIRDNPICDVSFGVESNSPSAYEQSIAEARSIIESAAAKWRDNDASAPSVDQLLNSILESFKTARTPYRK